MSKKCQQMGGGRLAQETIGRIKQAEESAAEAIRQAQSAAKETVKCGTADGEARRVEILAAAQTEREKILCAAALEAEADCAPLRRQGEEAVRRILNPEAAKFDSLVTAAVKTVNVQEAEGAVT
jgi:vacuolar-type H+-ATPase subunit H